MYKYLLNVTFYAGSDEPEDVDKGMYLLSVEHQISQHEMDKIFETVNNLLDSYNTEANNFPIFYYDNGLNIDTLMEGVEIYTKGTVIRPLSDHGRIDNIDNYYVISQWQ